MPIRPFRLLPALLFASAPALFATEHGRVLVQQNDGDNDSDAITLTLSAHSTPGTSIDAAASSRGDFHLDFQNPPGDDLGMASGGALITSIAENGRDNTFFGDTEGPLHGLSAAAINNSDNGYFIATHRAPGSGEFNIDTSFGWFPYDRWISGLATNSTENGPIDTLITASNNLLNLGSEFIDAADTDGIYNLDLTHLSAATPADGILLVSAAENEANFALSGPGGEGTFNIYVHDRDVNGSNYEQGAVAFVFLRKSEVGNKDGLHAIGRIRSDGAITLGETAPGHDPFFVTKASAGCWFLEIPGHSDCTGTLLLSPEGGGPRNNDNIVSAEWDDSARHWVVQSYDLPAVTPQNGREDEIMFSFAFFASPQIVVDEVADEDGATGPGDTSLREAIREADPGDVITFDPAVFTGGAANTITLTGGELSIDKDLVISAAGLSAPVTIDANGESTGHRVLSVTGDGSIVALERLIITGGRTPDDTEGRSADDGGGIYNTGHLTLCAVTVSGNATGDGNDGGTLGGFGGDGGGIYSNGTLNLRSSTVSSNAAGDGGDGSIFAGGGAHGGGITNNGGTLTLHNSTISDNATGDGGLRGSDRLSGGFGGGINHLDGLLVLRNSTVSGNATGDGGDGGGIVSSGTLILDHATVSNNRAGSGGGLHVARNAAMSRISSIRNSIVSGNWAKSGPDNIDSGDSTIHYSGENLTSDDDEDPDADPGLAPLGDYGGPTQTMPLLVGSPAIDGATGASPPTDQRGIPRDNSADIGAVEFLGGENYEPAPLRIIDFRYDRGRREYRVTFTTIPGESYTIFEGTDLRNFSERAAVLASGYSRSFEIDFRDPAPERTFIYVRRNP